MLWNKSYFYFCLWFHGERLWSWPFLHYFLGFQLKVQDLISAFMGVDAHDVQAFKWWNCTGKNPLHSSLAVMTRVECWMFQINRVFFYTVFPRSVNFWILFRPIAASGCHQKKKNCSTSTYFRYLSAKFVLFWIWPQPIARHETIIQKWLWPWLASRARL